MTGDLATVLMRILTPTNQTNTNYLANDISLCNPIQPTRCILFFFQTNFPTFLFCFLRVDLFYNTSENIIIC